MTSLDKAAIVWSVTIVAIAVGFTVVGNNSDVLPREIPADSVAETLPATTSLFLQTDRQTYMQDDNIKITGSVSAKLSDTPISLMISAPDGNLVSIAQLSVDENRNFSETIQIGGSLWKQEGKYTITVHYGEKNTKETSFDFVALK